MINLNEQLKSDLEERLNGIFGDAPGFQKSTVISASEDGENFKADVLERINIFKIW